MLLYAVLCLATALASGLKEEIPSFSPIFSVRMESFESDGYVSYRQYSKIWVDRVKGITREDLYDGQDQAVLVVDDKTWHQSIVYRVFPVTTEEYANVRQCFLVGGLEVYLYLGPLDTFPDLKKYGFYFDGKERVRDEDTSKWTAVFRSKSQNHTVINTIFVANKSGVSVPIRERWSSTQYSRNSYSAYTDYYDYETSDIDPEVWNIGAGMTCNFDTTSDADNSVLINDMIQTKVPEEFNYEHFDLVNDSMRYMEYKIGRLRYKTAMKQNYEKQSRNHSDQRLASESSRPSKVLPFPYSAEEVEQLSQALPEQFDWRLYGAVTPVPNTYKPSYHALTTASLVESALFIRNGMEVMVPLSAQAIIDCSWGFGNRGASGGSLESSLEWAMKYGLPAEDVYPYMDINDYCRIDEVDKITKVKAYYSIPPNDEMALKLAIVNHGPVAVVYDGWCYGLFFKYTGGIFYNMDYCKTYPGSGNTPGLLVGYGALDGEKYWILKHPGEGRVWGMNGYAMMAIRDNANGIMNSPFYVTVE